MICSCAMQCANKPVVLHEQIIFTLKEYYTYFETIGTLMFQAQREMA